MTRSRSRSPNVHSLRDLFEEELKDLYSAEQQIIKALPKMASASSSTDLRNAFKHHLEETRAHVERLELVFERQSMSGKGKKCEGMEGIIKEGAELLQTEAEPEVKDAGLIGAAQRVEHYEIASYGTARTFAEKLGERDIARLLQETLNEEGATEKRLTQIAQNINVKGAATPGGKSRSALDEETEEGEDEDPA